MRVSGQLDAIGEAASEIVHEVVGRTRIAVADVPARNQLCLGVDRRPRPDIAPTLLALVGGHVLLFAAYERPNLVALDALAGQIS
jgi:hypothetical protein